MAIVSRAIQTLPPSWIGFVSDLGVKSPLIAKFIRWAGTSMHERDQVIARGFAKGLKINIGFSHVGYVLGTTEPEVQAALDMLLRPGMTVYDIGANVGFHAIAAARRIGPDAKVVCFEALPDNAKRIEYNAASNKLANVQVIAAALGKSEGEAAFWTSRQPTWGKLASVGKKPDKFAKEVNVSLRRLDSVVDELKLPAPTLIKMDVEGSEIDVLEGARQTLERHHPILLIEAHGTNAAIENFLLATGYRVGVLGKNVPVAEAYWNAHIFGVSAEPVRAEQIFEGLRSIQA
jgi:FkbM family methyltransferase